MKFKYTLLAMVAMVGTSQAANLAVAGPTGDLTFTDADYWQGSGITSTIQTGETVLMTGHTFEFILQQNASGTSTFIVEAGGVLDASAGTLSDENMYFANNVDDAVGILDVNGGTVDLSGFGSVILGRDQGDGFVNISSGSVTFGAGPTFSNNANSTGIINFDGLAGSLTVTGQNQAYFEGLFAGGELQRNGANSGAFADHFQVTGDTLSVVPVPEPTSVALLGLGGLSLLFRRRS